MPSLNVGSLGDYIREQRESAQVSLRQLAHAAGVSNPYLSQIERGLKKPSAEILAQIANGLRISAETLYVRAGILDERHGGDVAAAVLADTSIGERHKRVLLDVYESFRAEHASTTGSGGATTNAVSRAVAQRPARKSSKTRAAGTRKKASTTGTDKQPGTTP